MSKLVDRNIYFDSVVLTQFITPISSQEVSLGSYSLATLKDPNFNRRGAHIIVEYTGKSGQYQGPIRQSTRGASFASIRDSDDEDTAVDYPIEPAFTQDTLNATCRSEYRRVVDGFEARTTVMQG